MRRRRILLLLVFGLILAPHSGAQQVYDGNQNLPPFGGFSGSDFDIVSLQNGNLHLHVPLGSWQQRGGKTLWFALIYDTPTWSRQTTRTTENGQVIYVTTVRQTSYGWTLSSNSGTWEVDSPIDSVSCFMGNQYHNWVVSDPEGTKHPLDLVTGFCGGITQSPTTDGSGLMVNLGSTPPLLTLKDGSKLFLARAQTTFTWALL